MLIDRSASREGRRASDQGYALIVAIWVTGLLALMVTGFTLSVRSHVRSTAVLREQAVAEGLADAGVHLARLDLVREHSRKDRPPSAVIEVLCSVDDLGFIRATATDEGGRVDLNQASPRLLQALLVGVGVRPADASRIAAAVVDFRDSDSDAEPGGAEVDDYARAGRPGLPKNAPFDSVSELGEVMGMSTDLLKALRAHVTVHAAQNGVDPAVATPELVAMLARGSRQIGAAVVIDDMGAELPRELRAPSLRRAFRIRSEALAGRARFAREAVVELAPAQSFAASIRSWRLVEADAAPLGTDRPPSPCR